MPDTLPGALAFFAVSALCLLLAVGFAGEYRAWRRAITGCRGTDSGLVGACTLVLAGFFGAGGGLSLAVALGAVLRWLAAA